MNRKARRIAAQQLRRHGPKAVLDFIATSDWLPSEAEFGQMAEILAEIPPDTAFFHGGLPGRAVGDFLLPSAATGLDPRGVGDNAGNARRRYAYFTDFRPLAVRYARKIRGGVVYRVEPMGQLGVDLIELRMANSIGFIFGSETHVAFTCDRACGLEVLQ